ncbi:hypothetical protein [Streptomyces sp. NBC_01455]|nr:hypothetical protein [Streptomyces sp. NBC_01455]
MNRSALGDITAREAVSLNMTAGAGMFSTAQPTRINEARNGSGQPTQFTL